MTFDEETADADFSAELIKEKMLGSNQLIWVYYCRFWPISLLNRHTRILNTGKLRNKFGKQHERPLGVNIHNILMRFFERLSAKSEFLTPFS